jgi:hypothetical protein
VLANLGDNYDSITDNMEHIVCDALGYAGYVSEELEKLRKLVAEMRTPIYPGCKGKWTKLFASLKFLQLKETRLFNTRLLRVQQRRHVCLTRVSYTHNKGDASV